MTSVTLLKGAITGLYKNLDGLWIHYPGAGVTAASAGFESFNGDDRRLIIDLDFNDFPLHQANTLTGVFYGSNGLPVYSIPKGAYIKSAVVDVDTGFTGSSAVMIFGLVNKAGLILNAGTTADNLISSTDGAVANIDGTDDSGLVGSGALINAVTTDNGYLYMTVTGGDFTAGHGRLTVTYWTPRVDTPTVVPA